MDRTPADTGIMTRLRQETMQLHRDVEHGAFQQDLISGRLSLEVYAALLHQLLLVHRTLEGHLRTHAKTHLQVGRIVRESQFQELHLCEDLRFLHQDPASVAPLPGSAALIGEIDAIAAGDPVALLGVHYVFEGSKNGGRFIADALRRAYGLQDRDGLRYLDPYGAAQSAFWRDFKDAMEAVPLSSGEQEAIVAAAAITFYGLIRIHGELHAATDPKVWDTPP